MDWEGETGNRITPGRHLFPTIAQMGRMRD